MVTKNIRFGELEARALFALEESEATFVASKQLARLLRVSSSRANKLAWQLSRKKRLLRLKKGLYLFAPLKAGAKGFWTEDSLSLVPTIAGNQPYYVGFWAALSYYRLTEQIPMTVQIVSTARLRNFDALQSKYEFFKVKKLGEWQEGKIGGKSVRFATIEQLIVDCLAYPGNCGGVKEACKALWEAGARVNWQKLWGMAASKSSAVQRRLGYLIELLGLRRSKKLKFAGWRWLDPSGSKKVQAKSVKWGLLLNVAEKDLTIWRES